MRRTDSRLNYQLKADQIGSHQAFVVSEVDGQLMKGVVGEQDSLYGLKGVHPIYDGFDERVVFVARLMVQVYPGDA